jgi:hypothetical protein
MRCRPLRLRHDGATFGFRMETTVGLFGASAALAYAADLGSWTAKLAEDLANVDVLALEFNHDVAMQYASGRSPMLISRNLSDQGHLSNLQASQLLHEVLRMSSPGRIRHVVQLHLSRDCNRRAIARQAAQSALGENNGILLHTARQDRPGATLHIGPASGKKAPVRKQFVRIRSHARQISSQNCLPGFEA